MNHLIVKADELYKIPLQEILCLVIENPSVSITGHLLNALSENKIITLLCDKNIYLHRLWCQFMGITNNLGILLNN
nr:MULTISPECIES: hypothetical protein [Staphylococcus]